MSSTALLVGVDPKFLTNYLFGLVIIILYAKDKFNTPTYDKDSMGPFSQLPPQLLTIDARYRHGVRTYILLLLALYTALCIIGPYTFSQQQLGIVSDNAELWPVASATFLISTAAAKDSSVLGRIEHFVRQYAQKAAYIPSVVSKLAYSIRNIETTPWLKENKDKLKPEEFASRKAALTALIGPEFVTKINDNPRQQGHLAAWARANIVFYCAQQMFRGVLPGEKLTQILESPDNVAIFERLKKERGELEQRLIELEGRDGKLAPEAEAALDKLLSDIQRFSKEVSLTVVVLMSQAVRTFSDLKERLEQLGFREIDLRDHSDHLVYLLMVNSYIVLGAIISYAFVTASAAILALRPPKSISYAFEWVQGLGAKSEPSNDFSVIDHGGDFMVLATGVLIYVIVFKVIDYLREGYLERSEWREGLQGYVTVVAMAGICSAVGCILLMVLLLPLGLLNRVWSDPVGLAHQFLYQLCVASLAAGFAVSHLRHAVEVSWRRRGHQATSRKVLRGLLMFREPADFTKLLHGALAACLVGILGHATIIREKNKKIELAKSNLYTLQTSFDQNQRWLGEQVKVAKKPANSVPRLQSKDLTEISCELRHIYAAIHVFNVGVKYFQLDPDFATEVNDSSSAAEAANMGQCEALSAKDATIAGQMQQLEKICSRLNLVGMTKTRTPSPEDIAPPGPLQIQPPGPPVKGAERPPPGPAAAQRVAGQDRPQTKPIIVPTLFLVPEKCELNMLTTEDPNEQNFKGLGQSLSDLFHSLYGLDQMARGAGGRAIVFPMITAFFIAYMFGAGCRTWRAWWLNNETGQEEITRLEEQIGKIYEQKVEPAEFERWLATPLNVLNNVAPKEAVRYEGLKARLYAKIESRQLDLTSVLAAPGHKAVPA